MIDADAVPEATASRERHADFLEIQAFKSLKRSVSFQEFLGDLRIANATEAIADSEGRDEEDQPDDRAESLAEAAFSEIDDRNRACGHDPKWYPFEVSGNTLTLRENADASLYTFLALLSLCGKDAGPIDMSGERIFEEVCAKATEAYLGGPHRHVRSYVFGFPRPKLPKGFKPALDALCKEMGEGGAHHAGREKLSHQKDAKLDVVAWREFEDRRKGKLIVFGQCATGKNWGGKVMELPDPIDWWTTWIADRPTVRPVRAFFVPHRVDQEEWFDAGVRGGLLYDRCRITSLASGMDPGLQDTWARWSSHVLLGIRKALR